MDSEGTPIDELDEPPFLTWREYSLAHYGDVLHRVPLDSDAGCPNRTAGDRGCTYCPGHGVRAVQLGCAQSLESQVATGISFARRRYRATAFMAYLQSFTPTHAPLAELIRSIETIFSCHSFQALAIGTRPDVLSPEVLDYLEELNQQTTLWVELGVQTTHDYTLKRIRRGHDWACSVRAITALAERGIKVSAHLLIGLPGEGEVEWIMAAESLQRLPLSGVKFHNLHLLKDTVLAEEYAVEPFPLLREMEYAEILMAVLRRIPSSWPVMRLSTDSAVEELIAPRWELSKGEFMEYLITLMKWREVRQGDLLLATESGVRKSTQGLFGPPIMTEDQSITFWNSTFKEHYHSPAGARSEAEKKFLDPSGLSTALKAGRRMKLLDVCFGLGYNSLVSCEVAADSPDGFLEVTALEIDRRIVGEASRWLDSPSNRIDWRGLLSCLYREGRADALHSTLQLIWGDARISLRKLPRHDYDCIYLDAFSTQRNAELWTLEFLSKLKDSLAEGGRLLTYCAALPVRSALLEAGFFVGETPAFGRNRGGTMAVLAEEDLLLPLPERDLYLICKTSRGIPYRDPGGCASNRAILRRRQEEIIAWKREAGGRRKTPVF